MLESKEPLSGGREVLWRLRNGQLASGVLVCRIFTRLVADLLRFTAGTGAANVYRGGCG